MKKPITSLLLAALSFSCAQLGMAREWVDLTGNVKINGTMIASDDKEVVIKLDKKHEGHELFAIAIEQLSQADRDYLNSEEATESLRSADEKQVWELKNGLKVHGKLVSFVLDDVTIQRKRGKIYVNDRVLENLPEVYQKMIPKLVSLLDKTNIETHGDLVKWAIAKKGVPVTYHVEAVTLEFPNGDEYDIPLAFLSDASSEALKPAYDQWAEAEKVKAEKDEKYEDARRQNQLYLQSRASAMQAQNQMLQIARLQLVMNSVTAGATNLWEVGLYPPQGAYGYPLFVVIAARDSRTASIMAEQQHPGYVAGPVRKYAGY